jgi:error-prone DNA polymerase
MPEYQVKPRVELDSDAMPPLLYDGTDPLPRYAELHCLSNFSFQRGASHPQELVRRAYNLGYEALAITDECSVAGVARAWSGWKKYQASVLALQQQTGQRYLREFRLLYGSEFDFGDGRLVAIARDLQGWGNLCEFITAARNTDAPKGDYRVSWEESNLELLQGCEILFAPCREACDLDALHQRLLQLKQRYGGSLWLALEQPHLMDDDLWFANLAQAGERAGVPLVATGNVHMHRRSRKPLHDVITAVRLGKPVGECGFALQANAERHLRQRKRLAGTFGASLLANTLVVQQRCRFELDCVSYNYPREVLPPGLTPTQALRRLTYEGARERYPQEIPQRVVDLVEKELVLIAECRYEMFFLTVHDIVRYARQEKILCQGRGSAANSVVCFCLGITAMDPMLSEPLLERFISKERRGEPPDIDVDFEHERREEVIQYIYRKYGRERAAIAAVVISYRTRSAVRDVGKALGLDEKLVDAFAKDHHWFDDKLDAARLQALAQQAGAQLPVHQATQWLDLAGDLRGFPRHLSQHVGGFVLTESRLTRLVPVEKASMKDRSIIQWDKDDLEELGLMKVDVLALGMLTAIRRCIDFVAQRRGSPFSFYDIPDEDRATYEMIRKADTVGVFQIESRAQMSMLPRLRPETFYDLVVQVAIVRPGPITGGMVHPYLKARDRRRQGQPIEYESPALEETLKRTLGIPIFQEQVMQIAMVAGGFSPGEADGLRRAMAAWKKKGDVEKYREKLVKGMLAKGYTPDFAQRIFEQVKGFADYGFPESHAYSFALLAYKSSWLKCHEPEAFLAAMLNSQPMGFYAPSQLVQDATRGGVVVRPPDVSFSDWDSTLEADPHSQRPPVRLGLHLVGGLSEQGGRRIVAARQEAPLASVEDMALRAQLDVKDLKLLAAADALQSLAGHRRQQVWEASAQRRAPELLREAPIAEAALALAPAREGEEIVFDYASLGLSLRRHPVALLRTRLARMRLLSAAQLHDLPNGQRVGACGMVTVRQQPGTASGTIFVTLEDETGPVNVIVWQRVREQQREPLLRARLLAVRGVWQRDHESGGNVRHLIAEHLEDLTPLLGRLGQRSVSRDFH